MDEDRKLHIRALAEKVDDKLLAVASEEVEDRDGEVISIDGWKLDNFKKNPVLLWLHNLTGRSLPIGKAKDIGFKTMDGGKKLVFEPEFESITDEGRVISEFFKQGYLKAFSVGFLPLEKENIGKEGEFPPRFKYLKQELLEISAVPVPSLPTATIIDGSKELGLDMNIVKSFIEEMENKSVIPYKQTAKAPVDEAWDGPRETREAETEDLKIMCAWFDSENPDTKSSYKLPHHKASGHSVVFRGVAAAMGALLGARGGVDIPDSDKKGVYNHLSKHYADFDKEPPEFRDYEEAELKQAFPELYEEKSAIDSLREEVMGAIKGLDSKIAHAIGEVQAYRNDISRKKHPQSEEEVGDEDVREALKIVSIVVPLALKRLNKKVAEKKAELIDSEKKGGE